MTDKSEVPEKCYKHLTDEDLGILLGGYRVIKFKDDPKELKGVDVPTGLELVYEIQRRLKKSGPNLSWDLAVDRRAPVEEERYDLPQSFSFAGVLTDEDRLVKQFDMIASALVFHKTYPLWWPPRTEVTEHFKAFLRERREKWSTLNQPTDELVLILPKEDNKVLQEINRAKAESGIPPTFCFVGYSFNLQEVMY